MIEDFIEKNFPSLVKTINENEMQMLAVGDFIESNFLIMYLLALAASLSLTVWLYFKQKEKVVRFTKLKIFFLLGALVSLFLVGVGAWLVMWFTAVDSFGF